jgi:multiple sugar transport system permease protein
MIAPTINMISTSFKTKSELFRFPPSLIPEHFNLDNYKALFTKMDFTTWYSNSLIIAIFSVIGTVISSSLITDIIKEDLDLGQKTSMPVT